MHGRSCEDLPSALPLPPKIHGCWREPSPWGASRPLLPLPTGPRTGAGHSAHRLRRCPVPIPSPKRQGSWCSGRSALGVRNLTSCVSRTSHRFLTLRAGHQLDASARVHAGGARREAALALLLSSVTSTESVPDCEKQRQALAAPSPLLTQRTHGRL